VRFLGRLDQRALLAGYAEHDVFIFPSLRDSGGMAVLEAMAAGLPVICLNVGGPALSVVDGTGIVVGARSPGQVIADLADAISAFATDEPYRTRLGAAARRHVEAHRSWDRIGEELRGIYAEVVAQTPGVRPSHLASTRVEATP
jgi:glycosyltransferase involved in cell wall biosynthesis